MVTIFVLATSSGTVSGFLLNFGALVLSIAAF
jgi:hypothetical protein